jgi:hypothetical protein
MATNVAFPGFGTILAGQFVTGSVQALLAVVGLALTLIYGLPAVIWALSNYAELRDPYGDPLDNLVEMWIRFRLPLLGILCFFFALGWAFLSSLLLVRKASRGSSGRVPPPLQP